MNARASLLFGNYLSGCVFDCSSIVGDVRSRDKLVVDCVSRVEEMERQICVR